MSLTGRIAPATTAGTAHPGASGRGTTAILDA